MYSLDTIINFFPTDQITNRPTDQNILKNHRTIREDKDPGLYVVPYSVLKKIKGLEKGKEKEGGKKRKKKENLGKIQLFAVPNHKK